KWQNNARVSVETENFNVVFMVGRGCGSLCNIILNLQYCKRKENFCKIFSPVIKIANELKRKQKKPGTYRAFF
ncbi:MAG: hypothetical protein J6K74_00855, partial [Marinifilaceae bacterium]|nr:hypothetical protein [Marinifilaceae bacterium]